jgi:hypothetical protein
MTKNKGLIYNIFLIFMAYSIVGALAPGNPQYAIWGYGTIGAYVLGIGSYYKKNGFN